tara:strand:+ start:23561 stop:24205 length:645 start_codon:yes stop_codon:yes gene_type:complete
MRGRGNNNTPRKGGNSRNQSYESNGPDVKVRGNAQQVVEKYLTLARDASSAGDRIAAESYYQFAEHYYRIMNANAANEQQRQQQNAASESNDDNRDGGQNGSSNRADRTERADNQDSASESDRSSSAGNANDAKAGASADDQSDTQSDAQADTQSGAPESNGRSRRRSSRGSRSGGAPKDPAEQPQPDVVVAKEKTAKPPKESGTEATAEDAGV